MNNKRSHRKQDIDQKIDKSLQMSCRMSHKLQKHDEITNNAVNRDSMQLEDREMFKHTDASDQICDCRTTIEIKVQNIGTKHNK